MFGKKKSTSPLLTLHQEKFGTLIGPQAEFEGQLLLGESVRIDGRVVGNVLARPDQAISVVIGPDAEVVGDVSAERVIVAGKVAGNIHAKDRIELHAGCLIQGDLKYTSIAVEHGARVQGLLLQVDAADELGRADQDAQQAIRRAQSTNSAPVDGA